MKTKLALSAVAAVALFSQAAFAQTSTSPSRAEVKSEAKAGAPRTGEAVGPAGSTPAGTATTRSRDERKSTTKTEAKSGDLKPAGEAVNRKEAMEEKNKPSQTTRADRKSETKAATPTPAGEAAQATPSGAPKK